MLDKLLLACQRLVQYDIHEPPRKGMTASIVTYLITILSSAVEACHQSLIDSNSFAHRRQAMCSARRMVRSCVLSLEYRHPPFFTVPDMPSINVDEI
jgi:hypothetical protein